jgi:hypothetical protein
MSGTIQLPSFLMSAEIVDNTTGDITPARVRDVIESLAGNSAQAKSASYTVLAQDRGSVLNITSASATNVTVNLGVLSAGHQFGVRQTGAGQVTIVAGTGMTRQSSSGTFATRAQYSLILVTVHIDGTTLLIDGDLA